eukprot:gene842-867_t
MASSGADVFKAFLTEETSGARDIRQSSQSRTSRSQSRESFGLSRESFVKAVASSRESSAVRRPEVPSRQGSKSLHERQPDYGKSTGITHGFEGLRKKKNKIPGHRGPTGHLLNNKFEPTANEKEKMKQSAHDFVQKGDSSADAESAESAMKELSMSEPEKSDPPMTTEESLPTPSFAKSHEVTAKDVGLPPMGAVVTPRKPPMPEDGRQKKGSFFRRLFGGKKDESPGKPPKAPDSRRQSAPPVVMTPPVNTPSGSSRLETPDDLTSNKSTGSTISVSQMLGLGGKRGSSPGLRDETRPSNRPSGIQVLTDNNTVGTPGSKPSSAGVPHGILAAHAIGTKGGRDYRWARPVAHGLGSPGSMEDAAKKFSKSHSASGRKSNLHAVPHSVHMPQVPQGGAQDSSKLILAAAKAASTAGNPSSTFDMVAKQAATKLDNQTILRMIGRYLTIKDACRGSQVSRRFKRLSACMESVDLSVFPRLKQFKPIGNILYLRALRCKNLNLIAISDINVLQNCRYLQRIDFTEAKLGDRCLKDLSVCKRLEYINLQDSDVTDVSPLGKILSLKRIVLRNTQIEDVSAIGECKKLRYLDLHDTKVKDLSALQTCVELEHLDLRQCEYIHPQTVTFEHWKELKNLNLFGTKISDISTLRNCLKLVVLNLWFTPVKTIWPIAYCVNMLHLDLSNTHIDSLVPLAGCNKLRHLSLWSTGVKDIEVLGQLTNLKRLDLTETCVSSISSLKTCTKLMSLHLWAAPLASVRALKYCKNLVNLDIADTDVSDITPLGHCTNLRWLCLRDTPVKDITPLAKCVDLEVLDLSGTLVSDLGPLSHCKFLEQLDIRHTKVQDESPVSPALQEAMRRARADSPPKRKGPSKLGGHALHQGMDDDTFH